MESTPRSNHFYLLNHIILFHARRLRIFLVPEAYIQLVNKLFVNYPDINHFVCVCMILPPSPQCCIMHDCKLAVKLKECYSE